MTRIATPAPSDSKPSGLSGLNSSLSMSPSPAYSVEAASVTTLQSMLAQVLEQTTVLWRAQASTNHILDELRQSIPFPRENADTHERLCRVESLIARLAQSQYVGLHPLAQLSQGMGGSSPYIPHNPMVLTQEAMYSSPTPRTDGVQPSLPRSTRDEAPPTWGVLPTGPGDLQAAGPTISPEQMILSPPGHGRVPTSLSPSLHLGNNTEGIPQSPQNPLEESDQKPSFPRSLEEAGTAKPTQCCIRNSTTEIPGRVQGRVTQGPDNEADNTWPLSFAIENLPRVATTERYEASRNCSVDPTSWIKHPPSICVDKKVSMERQLMHMVSCPNEDQPAVARRKYEESSEKVQNGDPRIERAELDKIDKHEMEHNLKALFQTLSDTWRADIQQFKEEVINAIRATASEQIPYNIQGYLDEFSKALAAEVRMLLSEVGRLREEKGRVQRELGYLMMMQATFSSGESDADRLPDSYRAPWVSPADIPLPERSVPRSAWRARAPPPPPMPVKQMPLWSWRPNPALAPSPPPGEPTLLVPGHERPGLFGPRSPCDSLPQQVISPDSPVSLGSWVSWRPNALFTPTPPLSSPITPVLRCGNPGLYMPRSPQDSPLEPPKQVANSEDQCSRDSGWDTWGPWPPSPLTASPPSASPATPPLPAPACRYERAFGSPVAIPGALPSKGKGPASSNLDYPSLSRMRRGNELRRYSDLSTLGTK